MGDLVLAVKNGRMKRVRQVIKHREVDVDELDSDRNSSLHLAVLRRNSKMVHLLLSAGATPNLVNKMGDTPLLLALKSTINVPVRKSLQDRKLCDGTLCAEQNLRTENDYRLNMKSGLIPLVQQLINAGANVDAVDLNGRTTWKLAFLNRDLDLVRLLLDAKTPPNLIDEVGDSPLQLAIRSGELDLVKQFIDAGANVDYFNMKSNHQVGSPRTPLHDAARECNVDILRLLLERGADPNEYSVLPAAAHAPRNKIPMLKVLFEHGAEAFTDFVFREQLEDNDVEAVKLYLDHGFDVERCYNQCADILCNVVRIWNRKSSNCSPDAEKTPEDTRMLSLFLNHFKAKGTLSFEVDRGDWRGWSALHDAARDGKIEHLRLLLRAGADPNIAARDDITPLDWTLLHDYSDNHDCIQLLIESGATLGNSIKSLLDRIYEAQRIHLSHQNYLDQPLKFIPVQEPEEIAKYLPTDDWEKYGKSHSRWALRSMKKAFCVVRYRALLESKSFVVDPIQEHIEKSSFLKNYYEACMTEISFLKDCQFDNSLTYHDLLVKENFYKLVGSLEPFERFHRTYVEKVSEKVLIYMKDLKIRSERACKNYKLWTSAADALEQLIGLDKSAHHLIFSNILDRLDEEDLRHLGNQKQSS
ncbi:hypothetical protein QAD02_000163 [Eretmocerus hayati]|uniref:Uncharacterized protein n=1 Tax=Eretmocerus hayati TaxID=131215 RepID=A0ACC2NCL0_9HYME|nr:hypothetical protein QAD02_000163 [Eretmocerus hayati]